MKVCIVAHNHSQALQFINSISPKLMANSNFVYAADARLLAEKEVQTVILIAGWELRKDADSYEEAIPECKAAGKTIYRVLNV